MASNYKTTFDIETGKRCFQQSFWIDKVITVQSAPVSTARFCFNFPDDNKILRHFVHIKIFSFFISETFSFKFSIRITSTNLPLGSAPEVVISSLPWIQSHRIFLAGCFFCLLTYRQSCTSDNYTFWTNATPNVVLEGHNQGIINNKLPKATASLQSQVSSWYKRFNWPINKRLALHRDHCPTRTITAKPFSPAKRRSMVQQYSHWATAKSPPAAKKLLMKNVRTIKRSGVDS